MALMTNQHDRIWKWIQVNLEMYRILKGAIDTSPVQKNYFVPLLHESSARWRSWQINMIEYGFGPWNHFARVLGPEIASFMFWALKSLRLCDLKAQNRQDGAHKTTTLFSCIKLPMILFFVWRLPLMILMRDKDITWAIGRIAQAVSGPKKVSTRGPTLPVACVMSLPAPYNQQVH